MEEKSPPQVKKKVLFSGQHAKHPHAKILNSIIRSNRYGKAKNILLTYQKADGTSVERKVTPIVAKSHLLLAHDHHRGDLRSFHIDRIQKMEKTAFQLGFEKKARKMSESQRKTTGGNSATKTIGYGLGGSLAAAGISSALPEKTTGGELRKLVRDFRASNPNTTPNSRNIHFKGRDPIFGGAKKPNSMFQAAFDPISKSVNSSPNLGVLAHELGHATGSLGASRKALAAYMASKMLHAPTSVLAPMAAARSDNKYVQGAAVAAPILTAAPMLHEEFGASFRGLNQIRKSFGNARALKSLPKLLAAGASYAALPVAGSVMAYKARNQVNDSRTK